MRHDKYISEGLVCSKTFPRKDEKLDYFLGNHSSSQFYGLGWPWTSQDGGQTREKLGEKSIIFFFNILLRLNLNTFQVSNFMQKFLASLEPLEKPPKTKNLPSFIQKSLKDRKTITYQRCYMNPISCFYKRAN